MKTPILTLAIMIILATTSLLTASTASYAQPSKPNHIRWCIDVVLFDFDGDPFETTSCGETKKDCRDNRERELNHPRTISVSECYKQKLDELK